MKTYTIPVKFTFTGTFKIKADNRAQAREYAEKHCGMVAGNGIHSTLPYEDVDWDFPVHPDKKVGR